jgi:hypothetical protein
VLPRQLRRFTAALAACSVLTLAALPAEHKHVARSAHADVEAAIVHRHYAAHHSDAAAAFDHEADQGVEWIAAAVAIVSRLNPPTIATAVPEAVSADFSLRRLAGSAVMLAEQSSHDPPWRAISSLRGPPSFV